MKKELKKPEQPQKRIIVSQSSRLPYASYTSIPLDEFVSYCKKTAVDGFNITIEAGLDGESYYDGCYCIPFLEMSWEQVIDNPLYDKQMKKYEKAMKKWGQTNSSTSKSV